MSARDVIAKAAAGDNWRDGTYRQGFREPRDADNLNNCHRATADAIIEALHTAGYRIVGPGDAETVERCRMAARDALDPSSFVLTGPAGVGMQIDAAIRAMVKP